MKASVPDKDAIMATLVYQIAITPKKVEGKDDCDSGVAGENRDTGISSVGQSKFDAIKVKRGCNYLVSMKVGTKASNTNDFQTVYLQNDPASSLLSKEELQKNIPSVSFTLNVTSEGEAYWDKSVSSPTTTEANTEVVMNPSIGDTKPQESNPSDAEGEKNLANFLTAFQDIKSDADVRPFNEKYFKKNQYIFGRGVVFYRNLVSGYYDVTLENSQERLSVWGVSKNSPTIEIGRKVFFRCYGGLEVIWSVTGKALITLHMGEKANIITEVK
jgi:hypothetical protein